MEPPTTHRPILPKNGAGSAGPDAPSRNGFASQRPVETGDLPPVDAMIVEKGLGPPENQLSSAAVADTKHRRAWAPQDQGRSPTRADNSGPNTLPQAVDQVATHGSVIVTRPPRSKSVARVCRGLLDARQWNRVKLLTDLIVLYLASSLALFVDPSVRAVASNRWLAATFPIVVAAMMRARRQPDERMNVSLLDTFIHVLGVVSLAAMLTISVDSILGGTDPLGLAPRLWLFSVVYLGTARAMLVSIRRQATRVETLATPTLILGAGMIGAHLVRRLVGEPAYGLRPVGFLDSDPLPPPASLDVPVPVLGGLEDLASAISVTGARRVILAFSSEPDYVLVSKVRECRALGVEVSLVPRLYEAINERTTLDHVGGLPLLTLHDIDPRGWQFAIKHAFDRTFAALTLLATAPLLLAIAIAVRASSSGPVLFRQRRVGRDGHEFDLLKFRTMREIPPVHQSFELADGLAPGGIEGSDRRTPAGRFLRGLSLDELPQLVNVLRGDMSIVGPRPERTEYVARFVRDVARYEDRHRVKSGITGWAQVHGLRGQTSISDRVEWDNFYIQNWSLRLDLRIIFLTIAEILRFRG
jgi:exopolysaccharide biosynthesis polyprenyl glycosylphosphotransferase